MPTARSHDLWSDHMTHQPPPERDGVDVQRRHETQFLVHVFNQTECLVGVPVPDVERRLLQALSSLLCENVLGVERYISSPLATHLSLDTASAVVSGSRGKIMIIDTFRHVQKCTCFRMYVCLCVEQHVVCTSTCSLYTDVC